MKHMRNEIEYQKPKHKSAACVQRVRHCCSGKGRDTPDVIRQVRISLTDNFDPGLSSPNIWKRCNRF
jgi:hypothetical protein